MKWIIVCATICQHDPVFTEEYRTYNECMAAVFLYLLRHDRKLDVYCKHGVHTEDS